MVTIKGKQYNTFKGQNGATRKTNGNTPNKNAEAIKKFGKGNTTPKLNAEAIQKANPETVQTATTPEPTPQTAPETPQATPTQPTLTATKQPTKQPLTSEQIYRLLNPASTLAGDSETKRTTLTPVASSQLGTIHRNEYGQLFYPAATTEEGTIYNPYRNPKVKTSNLKLKGESGNTIYPFAISPKARKNIILLGERLQESDVERSSYFNIPRAKAAQKARVAIGANLESFGYDPRAYLFQNVVLPSTLGALAGTTGALVVRGAESAALRTTGSLAATRITGGLVSTGLTAFGVKQIYDVVSTRTPAEQRPDVAFGIAGAIAGSRTPNPFELTNNAEFYSGLRFKRPKATPYVAGARSRQTRTQNKPTGGRQPTNYNPNQITYDNGVTVTKTPRKFFATRELTTGERQFIEGTTTKTGEGKLYTYIGGTQVRQPTGYKAVNVKATFKRTKATPYVAGARSRQTRTQNKPTGGRQPTNYNPNQITYDNGVTVTKTPRKFFATRELTTGERQFIEGTTTKTGEGKLYTYIGGTQVRQSSGYKAVNAKAIGINQLVPKGTSGSKEAIPYSKIFGGFSNDVSSGANRLKVVTKQTALELLKTLPEGRATKQQQRPSTVLRYNPKIPQYELQPNTQSALSVYDPQSPLYRPTELHRAGFRYRKTGETVFRRNDIITNSKKDFFVTTEIPQQTTPSPDVALNRQLTTLPRAEPRYSQTLNTNLAVTPTRATVSPSQSRTVYPATTFTQDALRLSSNPLTSQPTVLSNLPSEKQFPTIVTGLTARSKPDSNTQTAPVIIPQTNTTPTTTPKQINTPKQNQQPAQINIPDTTQQPLITPIVTSGQRHRSGGGGTRQSPPETVNDKPPTPPPIIFTPPPTQPRPRPTTTRRTETPPPPPPIPPFPQIKVPTQQRQQARGYNVLVRIKNRFVQVNQAPLTQKAATNYGIIKVRNTAAASFKVIPTTRAATTRTFPTQSLKGFYRSKKEKGVLIQQARNRISTFGEKLEIPYKAKKLGTTRNTRRLFGLAQ